MNGFITCIFARKLKKKQRSEGRKSFVVRLLTGTHYCEKNIGSEVNSMSMRPLTTVSGMNIAMSWNCIHFTSVQGVSQRPSFHSQLPFVCPGSEWCSSYHGTATAEPLVGIRVRSERRSHGLLRSLSWAIARLFPNAQSVPVLLPTIK